MLPDELAFIPAIDGKSGKVIVPVALFTGIEDLVRHLQRRTSAEGVKGLSRLDDPMLLEALKRLQRLRDLVTSESSQGQNEGVQGQPVAREDKAAETVEASPDQEAPEVSRLFRSGKHRATRRLLKSRTRRRRRHRSKTIHHGHCGTSLIAVRGRRNPPAQRMRWFV